MAAADGVEAVASIAKGVAEANCGNRLNKALIWTMAMAARTGKAENSESELDAQVRDKATVWSDGLWGSSSEAERGLALLSGLATCVAVEWGSAQGHRGFKGFDGCSLAAWCSMAAKHAQGGWRGRARLAEEWPEIPSFPFDAKERAANGDCTHALSGHSESVVSAVFSGDWPTDAFYVGELLAEIWCQTSTAPSRADSGVVAYRPLWRSRGTQCGESSDVAAPALGEVGSVGLLRSPRSCADFSEVQVDNEAAAILCGSTSVFFH